MPMPEASLAAWDIRDLPARLQPRLQALLPGLLMEVAASVDSTNTRLLEQARATPAGQPCTPCLLLALQQTGGRGRMGRAWFSAPGASLTFSLALPLAPASWSGLSLAVGLALADALDPQAPDGTINAATPRIGLKWPNDLWLWDGPGRGRKLGGILIETVVAGSQRVCVVGVGLNVAPQPETGASAGSACLQELQPGITAAQALDGAAAPLLQAVLQFEQSGFAQLAVAYASRDVLLGQAVHTLQAGRDAMAGIASGVDTDGALCVQAGNTLHRVVSGEVSVRLQQLSGAPHAVGPGALPC